MARHTHTSWIDIPEGCDFTMYNIPFGVFKIEGLSPRCCTAIGECVVDLAVLSAHGYFSDINISPLLFQNGSLNEFIALGKPFTSLVRDRLVELFSKDNHELEEMKSLHPFVFYKQEVVTMMLPVTIGDYTDFFCSMHHAKNCGLIFRGPETPVNVNWYISHF